MNFSQPSFNRARKVRDGAKSVAISITDYAVSVIASSIREVQQDLVVLADRRYSMTRISWLSVLLTTNSRYQPAICTIAEDALASAILPDAPLWRDRRRYMGVDARTSEDGRRAMGRMPRWIQAKGNPGFF